jgi:hypothetical protein
MDALTFLDLLFGDSVSESNKLVIWQETGKRAFWFSSIPDAVDFVQKNHTKCNTYFGVALHDEAKAKAESKAGPDYARGSARSATAIGGVWIDIDVKNDQHAKGGLASNLNMVIDALVNLPIRPSCINTTGGGLHAWYAFKEPWTLENDEERAKAQAVVEGFQRWVQKVVGFTVDMTFDLARVLRLPGTLNHKYTPSITVAGSLPFTPPPKYNPSDFEEYSAKPRSIAKVETLHPLVIDLEVKIPEKLTVILAHDVDFHSVWHRIKKFQSDSEYDMSIASRLVRFDSWTDQEICDAIIAHRRMHGGSVDRKDFRQEKIAFTIAKARKGYEDQRKKEENDEISRAMRIEQLDHILDQIDVARSQIVAQPITTEVIAAGAELAAATVVTPAQPAQIAAQELVPTAFALVNEQLGLPREKSLMRIVRYSGDEGVYVLHTMVGQVKLGSIENLHYPDKFAMRLADGVQINIQPIRSAEWRAPDGLYSRLLRLIETVDIGFGGRIEVTLGLLLQKYCERGIQDRDNGLMMHKPFLHDGEVWGSVEGLMNIQNSLPAGFQIFRSSKDLLIALRRCDTEHHDFNFSVAASKDTAGQVKQEKRGKRSAWRLTRDGVSIFDSQHDLMGLPKKEDDGAPF